MYDHQTFFVLMLINFFQFGKPENENTNNTAEREAQCLRCNPQKMFIATNIILFGIIYKSIFNL